jgi:hypothetical protein
MDALVKRYKIKHGSFFQINPTEPSDELRNERRTRRIKKTLKTDKKPENITLTSLCMVIV